MHFCIKKLIKKHNMKQIFSQKINRDEFDAVYECLINTENNNVGFTYLNEYPNGKEIISFFTIDFLSLQDFINNGKINYENSKYQFIENEHYFKVHNKSDNQHISLPKTFLFDSYNVLKSMWEDD
jgi:hypothetical protein